MDVFLAEEKTGKVEIVNAIENYFSIVLTFSEKLQGFGTIIFYGLATPRQLTIAIHNIKREQE